MTETTEKIHKFEKAGLGRAPFRLVSYERITYQACHGAPIQPGGCCDYCGTGIMDAFWIRSADGNRFKVGSDCVEKTGDRGLVNVVKRQANRIKRERQLERENARIENAVAFFTERREIFEALPHPRGFTDRKTGAALTLADQIDWMLANSGHAGTLKTARQIEKVAKDAPAVQEEIAASPERLLGLYRNAVRAFWAPADPMRPGTPSRNTRELDQLREDWGEALFERIGNEYDLAVEAQNEMRAAAMDEERRYGRTG